MTSFGAFYSEKVATVEQMFPSAVISHNATEEKLIVQMLGRKHELHAAFSIQRHLVLV